MSENADAYTIPCHGDLTLASIDELHQAVLAAFPAQRDIVLDCMDVGDADLSFVQLIVAARRSAAATGKAVRVLADPGGSLATALLRGGLVPEEAGPSGIKNWLKGEE